MTSLISHGGEYYRAEYCEALLRHAEMIMRTADDISEQYDRADVTGDMSGP